MTLHVLNVERSREFYARLPSAVLLDHQPGRFAFFRVGASSLGLVQLGTRGFHLEVASTDLDETYARVLQAGLEVAGPPVPRPWGQRAFNVIDPDGNVLEFDERWPPSRRVTRKWVI